MAELVYTRTFRGIVPAVHHVPQLRNGKPVEVLARHTLTDEQAQLTLAELSSLFPPPSITTEDGTKLELK